MRLLGSHGYVGLVPQIFCVHGGIPPPTIDGGKIAAINRIPCPLPCPETQSPLAWEIMWNDPIR